MKSLQQTIAETLAELYGWPLERVQDSARQVAFDIQSARTAAQGLRNVPVTEKRKYLT